MKQRQFYQTAKFWLHMKSPCGPECWNLGPQLVMLFWEVVEILGGRAEEQEVGHWGHALGL